MNNELIAQITNKNNKKRPEVKIGDTVRLHVKIKEGDKERIQVFEGTVIVMRGSSLDRTITVRKMSYGVGVERIFPLNSDTLEKLEVVKRGKVRKSKLYYMKRKIGKSALKVGNISDVYFTDEEIQEESTPEETPAEEVTQVVENSEEK